MPKFDLGPRSSRLASSRPQNSQWRSHGPSQSNTARAGFGLSVYPLWVVKNLCARRIGAGGSIECC